MGFPFYIVDVFAETRYSGNQLAVFTDAGQLTTAQMQAFAKEINFSETTFILSPELNNGGYDVRIFTPVKELPFAGHPTLGTAYVLQQAILQQPVELIVLNLAVGPIPVGLHYQGAVPEMLWMQQNPPVFGPIVEPGAIAAVLGLESHEIDARFPVQVVSTGIPFLLVPLKHLAALQHIQVNVERLFQLVENLEAKEIFVFCPETRHPTHHFSARMFAHYLGIPEDPATGSANGCFAAYLSHYRYFGDTTVAVQVEQGYEMGRPSLLWLKAEQADRSIRVQVGGRVVMVAQGRFF